MCVFHDEHPEEVLIIVCFHVSTPSVTDLFVVLRTALTVGIENSNWRDKIHPKFWNFLSLGPTGYDVKLKCVDFGPDAFLLLLRSPRTYDALCDVDYAKHLVSQSAPVNWLAVLLQPLKKLFKEKVYSGEWGAVNPSDYVGSVQETEVEPTFDLGGSIARVTAEQFSVVEAEVPAMPPLEVGTQNNINAEHKHNRETPEDSIGLNENNGGSIKLVEARNEGSIIASTFGRPDTEMNGGDEVRCGDTVTINMPAIVKEEETRTLIKEEGENTDEASFGDDQENELFDRIEEGIKKTYSL